MSETPNDLNGAMQYLIDQEAHLNPPAKYGTTWHNDCQALAHVEYGVMEGGNPSAYAQWLATPAVHKHPGGSPNDAPVGALLFSKGTSIYGHVWTAVRPFPNGTPGGRGPDMSPNVFGGVSKFRRDAPMTVWGHRYLGWGMEINGYFLDLNAPNKVARPVEKTRYARLGRSIELLQDAVETAKEDHDKSDVEALRKQIAGMKKLYDKIRHS